MKQKERNWRYYVNLSISTIGLLAFALLLLTGFLADRWVYAMLHPQRIPATGELLEREHIPFQKVKLITKDGLQLAAWYTPPKNGAVILVAHGYNDNRPEYIYSMLTRHGYGVLAWDFRAHGDSEGELTTIGYNEQMDVEAALDYALTQEGVEHIGAWGGSMGAATVVLTASKQTEIEAVISDSGFTALEDVFAGSSDNDFLTSFLLMSSRFHSGVDMADIRPVDVIGNISPRAVFIIDGWTDPDTTVSFPHRLYEAANEPRQIWVEEGVPHLGMLANNPQKYENKVIAFFDEWLLDKK
jgi:pimeloyl-ACP methyl ester carboxylesterase